MTYATPPPSSSVLRAWRWPGHVDAADPVRHALNSGLAWVLLHSSVFTPPEEMQAREAAIAQIVRTGRATYETEYVRKDGSRVPVLVTGARLASGEEGVAFVLDLSEQRRLEAERSAREAAEAANQAKTTFLANMSHELRTPLNAILGFAQLMESDTGSGSAQRRSAGFIRESGEHLLALIEDVLDIARVEAGRLELFAERVELASFLEAVVATGKLRARVRSNHFAFEAAPALPAAVLADAKRLRQVLLNLLDNAFKFTEHGHEAADGQQAVEEARRMRPDLILIDSIMPAVDGVRALAHLRSISGLETTPIISISASAMAADRERCLAAGADAFLPKPVDVALLLDKIQVLLNLEWTEGH